MSVWAFLSSASLFSAGNVSFALMNAMNEETAAVRIAHLHTGTLLHLPCDLQRSFISSNLSFSLWNLKRAKSLMGKKCVLCVWVWFSWSISDYFTHITVGPHNDILRVFCKESISWVTVLSWHILWHHYRSVSLDYNTGIFLREFHQSGLDFCSRYPSALNKAEKKHIFILTLNWVLYQHLWWCEFRTPDIPEKRHLCVRSAAAGMESNTSPAQFDACHLGVFTF